MMLVIENSIRMFDVLKEGRLSGWRYIESNCTIIGLNMENIFLFPCPVCPYNGRRGVRDNPAVNSCSRDICHEDLSD